MLKQTQRGFTLIELSIALVIIGLLMSMFLSYGTAQLSASRILSTKQKQEAIKLGLISFISRNHRLPCPALANLNQGASGYGVEATGCSGTVATGILPWSSLGLTESSASDAYHNRFTYQVSVAATTTTDQTVSGMVGVSTTHTTSPTIAGNAPTGNQSNNCSIGNTNPCAAVAVIVSHGQNGSGAFTNSGNQNALPTGTDELENTDNDEAFVVKEFSDTSTNAFDDIVLPLTASELLTPLTTNGSIPDTNASLTQDFTNIKAALIARAVSNRTGIAGSYSYPVQAVLPTLSDNTQRDPWGNLYTFTRNTSLTGIDSSTNAGTLVYTISSGGPDGYGTTTDNIDFEVYVNELQDAYSKAGW